jgi:predicted Zn-dependent peptidase
VDRIDYHLHTFPNGVKWVHKQVKNTKITHSGIMLDIGSRDEQPNEIGLAHFWEHMAFKGTHKYNANYIANRIDNLGGELNAYTTKEKICFHSSVLSKHADKAIGILTDITFNSIFPPKEIQKEKNVILEEMSMYADNPDDAIQDEFDTILFHKHPLGNNILGTKESVNSFVQSDFLNFIKNNINTNRLILSTVSNKTYSYLFPIIEKHISTIAASENATMTRVRPKVNRGIHKTVKKPIQQAHVMMGAEAYDIYHEDRLPLFLLINLLGGPAMNTRLNLAVREKHGLVYNIDAQYIPYTDCGVFNIYFGTDKSKIQKAIDLVWKELNSMKSNLLTSKKLKLVKEQLKGQLAMSEENNNGMMLLMAKSMLDQNKIESLDSIFAKIDAISSEKISEIAIDIFDESKMNYLIYEPEG